MVQKCVPKHQAPDVIWFEATTAPNVAYSKVISLTGPPYCISIYVYTLTSACCDVFAIIKITTTTNIILIKDIHLRTSHRVSVRGSRAEK